MSNETETVPVEEAVRAEEAPIDPVAVAVDSVAVEPEPEPERLNLRAWGALKGAPEWQLRAAETFAALNGLETSSLTEEDFDAAMKRVA